MAKIKKIRCNGTLYEQSEISSGCMPRMTKQQRAKRSKITSEGKKVINTVESKLMMMRYICLNFVSGKDLKIELTYAGDEPTSTQAARYLSLFHAAMREFYRKLGYEYKYIAVTEHHGKDGAPARVHHHLIINAIPGMQNIPHIIACWQKACKELAGFVNVETLFEHDNFEDTASYFLKEKKEKGKRRWTRSLNLIKPEPPQRFLIPEKERGEIPDGVKIFYESTKANEYGSYAFYIGRIIDIKAFERYQKRHNFKRRNQAWGKPHY